MKIINNLLGLSLGAACPLLGVVTGVVQSEGGIGGHGRGGRVYDHRSFENLQTENLNNNKKMAKQAQKLDAKTEAKARELGIKLKRPVIYVNTKTGQMLSFKKAAQMGAKNEGDLVAVTIAATKEGEDNEQG